MTRNYIRSMVPGPELDKAVAQALNSELDIKLNEGGWGQFSCDISAAMYALDKVDISPLYINRCKNEGGHIRYRVNWCVCGQTCESCKIAQYCPEWNEIVEDTLPAAIAKAILLRAEQGAENLALHEPDWQLMNL